MLFVCSNIVVVAQLLWLHVCMQVFQSAVQWCKVFKDVNLIETLTGPICISITCPSNPTVNVCKYIVHILYGCLRMSRGFYVRTGWSCECFTNWLRWETAAQLIIETCCRVHFAVVESDSLKLLKVILSCC